MPRQARIPLARYERPVLSVFDLLGDSENDMTAALGFVLASSESLLRRLACRILPDADVSTLIIRIETPDKLGRTDLELDGGTELAVIEAKRGWLLPGEVQLRNYVPRVHQRGAGVLVSLSNASAEWAGYILPREIDGVELKHLSWSDVRADVAAARREARGRERIWLDEMHDYLEGAVRLRDIADSWTYCVVVSTSRPGDGGSRTFRDFVVQENTYFHPFGWGGGWPKTPPNFLAFRWDSQVQRIHRVTGSQVVPNLQTLWPDIPVTADDTGRPYVVYQLGPPLPGTPISSGRTYRATRLWVLLDTLLTAGSLAAAAEQTSAMMAAQ
jgi:hypothetical protein